MNTYRTSLLLLTALLCVGQLPAQTQTKKTGNAPVAATPAPSGTTTAATAVAPIIMATDPSYRLSLGDEISIAVHSHDDISTAQRIDKKGFVRMPLINEVNLADKTVREAEGYIEQMLVEKKILRKPLVNITVRDYSIREIVISGTGLNPGVFPLPRETASIEITELVTRLGGFRPTAKADAVKVIRTDDDGKETTQIVDVESMLTGKRNALKSFLIYPGDRIFVDERLF
jgi:protein involved in polysaccharide export with SLBB domain